MTFPSIIFLFVFLPCTLGLYCVVKPKTRRWLLIVYSFFFYAWGGVWNACLLLGFVTIVYALGRYIGKADEEQRKYRLRESMVLFVLILFYFKYYGFFLDNVFTWLSISISYEVFQMPMGISFVMFTAMGYLIDIRRGKLEPVSFLDTVLYLSFFPKLIMGPIERYDIWSKNLSYTWNWEMLEQGAIRLLMGLSQKLLLADGLAEVWVYTSTHPSAMASAWLGLLAYTFQIYFDFQGYMNMAIGVANMFGFNLQENFEHPYMAESVTQFWRRWHKTLGSWFKDYIYIPLGGSRKGTLCTLRNLLIVWGLTGIWHGANWTFLLWGLYYGVLLILEKFVFRKQLARIPVWLLRPWTFVLVMLGWVLFASPSIGDAMLYYKQLFTGINGFFDTETISLFVNYGVKLLAAAIFCTEVPLVLSSNFMHALQKQHWFLKPILTAVVLIILLSCLLSGGYQTFLYVQF